MTKIFFSTLAIFVFISCSTDNQQISDLEVKLKLANAELTAIAIVEDEKIQINRSGKYQYLL